MNYTAYIDDAELRESLHAYEFIPIAAFIFLCLINLI